MLVYRIQLSPLLPKPDSYVALRFTFSTPKSRSWTLSLAGAQWFQIWLDGENIAEGPVRFVEGEPEWQQRPLTLEAGNHVLAVIVHYIGVETRMLKNVPPFFAFKIEESGLPTESTAIDQEDAILTSARCRILEGFSPQRRRLNPQLAWIEWCDTRLDPPDWQSKNFDDSHWSVLDREDGAFNEFVVAKLGEVLHERHNLTLLEQGEFTEVFGYEKDDPPVCFFLRELQPVLPLQGIWRRYDLGRVRLGRVQVTLQLPPGRVVQLGYAEALMNHRVFPVIPLSDGTSCNLDHYISRGGRQTLGPMTPRGGRFLEIHVGALPEEVEWIDVCFLERCYYEPAKRKFLCNDSQLNRIWEVGLETMRACTEDALTDSPTRERGQWTGDITAVGLENVACVYSDLRPIRRGLVQAAHCANKAGMVAGLFPGGTLHMGSYALQWGYACIRYHQLTGDASLLEECFESAGRNLDAFEPSLQRHLITKPVDWPFIDWGHVLETGRADLALNFHYLRALRAFVTWCKIIGQHGRQIEAEARLQGLEMSLRQEISERLNHRAEGNRTAWMTCIGYHASALALLCDVVSVEAKPALIEELKSWILSCFPNNPEAPRLSNPSAKHRQLITPYFSHFVLEALIRHGEIDFVLEQYRVCWGWMLDQESGTWLEVFDPRWSHCHQWSSCPTWQLSRFVLGLHPRFDWDSQCYELSIYPSSLTHAEGQIPLGTSGKTAQISWEHSGDKIDFRLETDCAITIVDSKRKILSTGKGWQAILTKTAVGNYLPAS